MSPDHELIDRALTDGTIVVYDAAATTYHTLEGQAAETWRADAAQGIDRRATLKRLLALGAAAGVATLLAPSPAAAYSTVDAGPDQRICISRPGRTFEGVGPTLDAAKASYSAQAAIVLAAYRAELTATVGSLGSNGATFYTEPPFVDADGLWHLPGGIEDFCYNIP